METVMAKSSVDYAELFGLRVTVRCSHIPDDVKAWIQKRIEYLENK